MEGGEVGGRIGIADGTHIEGCGDVGVFKEFAERLEGFIVRRPFLRVGVELRREEADGVVDVDGGDRFLL